ncbi:MAG: hypothetical protein J6N19_09160 [Clostridium sp.]|nr:hypothetical protein [Clostridium sp.]
MAYRVCKAFFDLKDNGHPYFAGDAYPRQGMSVSPARIAELAGSNNRQRVPLIIEEPEVEAAKSQSARRKEPKTKRGA